MAITRLLTFASVTTTGPSAEWVTADGINAIVFLVLFPSGTATVKLQQSIDDGANWTDLPGAATSTTGTLLYIPNVTTIAVPTGRYRFNVTAISGATVTVKYRMSGLRALS